MPRNFACDGQQETGKPSGPQKSNPGYWVVGLEARDCDANIRLVFQRDGETRGPKFRTVSLLAGNWGRSLGILDTEQGKRGVKQRQNASCIIIVLCEHREDLQRPCTLEIREQAAGDWSEKSANCCEILCVEVFRVCS